MTIVIYLAPRLLVGSSGTSLNFFRDTALHTSKDLAVATASYLGTHPIKVNLIGAVFLSVYGVSVRTSWITPDGRYPLLVFTQCESCVRTFLSLSGATIRHREN